MIVALGLPLKVATIILGCIFSIPFSVFRACGPIRIPTPPIVELIEFFYADAVASVHPLPVSWYLISSLCVYMCSWMHIMSILWCMADAVSSGSSPILFKVLTLNVAICIVCLPFSIFCCLSSVADFSNARSSVSSTGIDINSRLTKAWTGIIRLSVIWKSELTDKMKCSFFQAAVVSILLYGCTTWTLTKRLEKKTWRKLQKNTASNIGQVLESTHDKATALRPPTTRHESYLS